MPFVGNMTQISEVVVSAVQPYLLDLVMIFVVGIVGYLVLDFFHNRHVEKLGQQLADTTTLAINAVQNMLTLDVTTKQASYIMDKKSQETEQK
ncbi:hypothetical protein [Acidilobus sp.]|uniref:hypothetical protein n=1 Tax=Acidilobus sp. TaxID=1872109 RepID=UPI003D063E21